MRNLTQGKIGSSLLLFTLPMIVGSLLQQTYNLADTWMVGHYIGAQALAAVGASYSLMVFLISIFWGLAMGSGTVVSLHYGAGNGPALRQSSFVAFVLISLLTVVLTLSLFAGLDSLLVLLQVPPEVRDLMRTYLWIVFWGLPLVCLYNYYAALLRALGDAFSPLCFLSLSVVLNVVLDFAFIVYGHWGIAGAAVATVLSQAVAALGLALFAYVRRPEIRWGRADMIWNRERLREIFSFSMLTCLQQSVMNFGILLVQGLVNSFGAVVMAAFAIAVKIDTLAYMPVQEFGNAFSTFVAQNYGAQQHGRIRQGIRVAFLLSGIFSLLLSALIYLYARPLMQLFVSEEEAAIVEVGVSYLQTEGLFYIGIGFLFLLYGYYRAIRLPGMSVVLTILSLGTRVILAYVLSAIPEIHVHGIWWSIPIGWFLADAVGIAYYVWRSRKPLALA